MISSEFNKTFITILLVAFLLFIIFFEASQQLFYIREFNLPNAENVRFFELLRNQFYRWLIWLLLGFILIRFVKDRSQKKLKGIDFLHYALLIVGLVFMAVLLISLVNAIQYNSSDVLGALGTYVPFYLYQKGLVFTFAYTVVVIILHLFYVNLQLQFHVTELSQLKQNNNKLYKRLSQNVQDDTTILDIKIGNKRKIILVKDISWVEADDYCVKIHLKENTNYTMRSSLKNLENKLVPMNFLRVHRNALVNMNFVKEINYTQVPYLILQNGVEVHISKSKLKQVKDHFSKMKL